MAALAKAATLPTRAMARAELSALTEAGAGAEEKMSPKELLQSAVEGASLGACA